MAYFPKKQRVDAAAGVKGLAAYKSSPCSWSFTILFVVDYKSLATLPLLRVSLLLNTIDSLPVLFKQKKNVFFFLLLYLYVSFGATDMTHKACIFIVGCIHLSTVVIISMAAVAYVRETGGVDWT